MDTLCGEGGLTSNWIPLYEEEGLLERYVDAYSITKNEDGYINYWILVNYFEDKDSVYDLIEIDCDGPQNRLRTKYRRRFSEHNGKAEEGSYEHITDWLYPPEGSNYAIEIETICEVVEKSWDY